MLPAKARNLPFKEAAKTIQSYRENNWRLGFNLEWAAAAKDLEDYTCLRLPQICKQSQEEIQAHLTREATLHLQAVNCPGCGRTRRTHVQKD